MTSQVSRHAIAAVILLAAALTYAFSSGSAQSAQSRPTPSEESAISHVAAFQRAAAEGDKVPGETQLEGRVRRVGDDGGAQRHIWASITPTQVCVQVGENGQSACDTPERLEEEPLIVGAWRSQVPLHLSADQSLPEPEVWAGLVVNDVEAIDVTYGDGATETIPVANNGFYVQAEGREVKSFRWVTSGGTIHVQKED
jgi:hypothetical protein